jgi:aspartyl-tRNA(Asn)/glutamyl-tRNA(Gln) amidotransferase subunit A
MDLKSLTIDAARSAVQRREITAMALAEAHYARIKQEDGQIGAFLTLSKERALEQAGRMDRLARTGWHCLHGGVPVGIKDVMSIWRSKLRVRFWRTTFLRMTARPWRGWRPQEPVLGKMNCDEFAMVVE